jgi:hypothetical protein
LTLDLSQLAGHVSHFLRFLGRHLGVVLGVLTGDLFDERGFVMDVESADGDLGLVRYTV